MLNRPMAPTFHDKAENHVNPLIKGWASEMLKLSEAGGLPTSCPQEIQVVRFNEEMQVIFLGGEVLTEIGLHIKNALQPATTITVAYSNGLIAYVPSKETYALGGYEVNGSHFYFLRPAPFAKEIEDLIVAKTVDIVQKILADRCIKAVTWIRHTCVLCFTLRNPVRKLQESEFAI